MSDVYFQNFKDAQKHAYRMLYFYDCVPGKLGGPSSTYCSSRGQDVLYHWFLHKLGRSNCARINHFTSGEGVGGRLGVSIPAGSASWVGHFSWALRFSSLSSWSSLLSSSSSSLTTVTRRMRRMQRTTELMTTAMTTNDEKAWSEQLNCPTEVPLVGNFSWALR